LIPPPTHHGCDDNRQTHYPVDWRGVRKTR